MGTYAKQGKFTLSTTVGNQSITGVGFVPKVVLVWCHQFATVSGSSEAQRFYGAATSSANQFVTSSSVNGYIGQVTRQTLTSNCILLMNASTSATIAAAAFVSVDSDGFTIYVSTGASVSVNYLALGGNDLSAKVGYFDVLGQTSPFTQSVTGVGFQPKAAMFFNTAQFNNGTNLEANDNGEDGIDVGIAAQSTTLDQESTVHFYQPVTPVTVRSNQPGSSTTLPGYAGTSNDMRGVMTSFDADGFTMNFPDKLQATSVRVPFIALGGSSLFEVGSVTEPTATGAQTVSLSSSKLRPAATIFLSVGTSNLNSTYASDSVFSFGVAVNSTQQTTSTFVLPSGTLTTTSGNGTTSSSYSLGSTSTSSPTTLVSAGNVSARSSGNFTVNWSTVSGGSIRYSFLTIGDVSTPSRMMIGIFN